MSTSTQLKPITVWGKGGANPPKVAIILNELGIPHEVIATPLGDVKKPEYVAINPNGPLPSIQDPNTDITLFARDTPEWHHAQQWLFFQTTGQGPYYGQAAWFGRFHHEKLPSALERYVKETHSVTAVLEGHLTRQRETLGEGPIEASGGPWLVGNKCSCADLAWVPWQLLLPKIVSKEDGLDLDRYPVVATGSPA